MCPLKLAKFAILDAIMAKLDPKSSIPYPKEAISNPVTTIYKP